VSTWSEPALSPITLLIGPESYLAGRALQNLRNRARAQNPELEIVEISDYSPGALLSAAAPSLFAEPRLISVTALGDGLLEELLEFSELDVSDVFVVVRVPNLTGQGGKLKNGLKAAQIIACDELRREADRSAFVKQEFAAAGLTAEPAAVRSLVEAFAEDLGELGAACQQLAASATKQVTKAQVDAIFMGRVETNSFKIADAALSGNTAEAIRLLRHGLSTGVDSVALAAALAMRVRQLARISSDRQASAASLGIQQWQLDRIRKDLAGWTEAGLANLVRLSAETDHAVKGASRDPEYALEKMLLAMGQRV